MKFRASATPRNKTRAVASSRIATALNVAPPLWFCCNSVEAAQHHCYIVTSCVSSLAGKPYWLQIRLKLIHLNLFGLPRLDVLADVDIADAPRCHCRLFHLLCNFY